MHAHTRTHAYTSIHRMCIHTGGSTPLTEAVKYGNKAMVNLLMRHADIDINYTDMNSATPLMVASYYGHVSLAMALLEAGRCVVARLSTEGFIACSCTVMQCCSLAYNVREFLHADTPRHSYIVCVRPSIHIYIFACLHIYIYVYIHMHMYMYIRKHTHVRTYIYTRAYTHIYTHMHSYIHAGADTGAVDANGWSATMMAFSQGHSIIAHHIIKAMAKLPAEIKNQLKQQKKQKLKMNRLAGRG